MLAGMKTDSLKAGSRTCFYLLRFWHTIIPAPSNRSPPATFKSAKATISETCRVGSRYLLSYVHGVSGTCSRIDSALPLGRPLEVGKAEKVDVLRISLHICKALVCTSFRFALRFACWVAKMGPPTGEAQQGVAEEVLDALHAF